MLQPKRNGDIHSTRAWSELAGLGISGGLGIGLAVGVAMGNIGVGLAIGIALGVALGGAVVVAQKRERDASDDE